MATDAEADMECTAAVGANVCGHLANTALASDSPAHTQQQF